MNSLDNILGGSTAASEGQTEVEQNVTQTATEGASQTEQQAETQTTEGDSGGQMVPQQALHREKEKVKRYTEEVADFRRSNEALQRQVAELMQRIPVPQQQEPPAPTDFFSDPDKAFSERLQSHLGQALGPLQAQFVAQAQMLAGIKFGDDKVAEAEQAFTAAARAGTLDPADYHRVFNSPNRYAEAVKWHQAQQARAEIGDDPAAFRAKVEAEIREKIAAEQGTGGGQQVQQHQQVMPSNLAAARTVGNRTAGPAWSGPATLQDIFDRRPLNG